MGRRRDRKPARATRTDWISPLVEMVDVIAGLGHLVVRFVGMLLRLFH